MSNYDDSNVTGYDHGSVYRAASDGYIHEYVNGVDLGMTWQERQRAERDKRQSSYDSYQSSGYYTGGSYRYSEPTYSASGSGGGCGGGGGASVGESEPSAIVYILGSIGIVFLIVEGGKYLLSVWGKYFMAIGNDFRNGSFGIGTIISILVPVILLIRLKSAARSSAEKEKSKTIGYIIFCIIVLALYEWFAVGMHDILVALLNSAELAVIPSIIENFTEHRLANKRDGKKQLYLTYLLKIDKKDDPLFFYDGIDKIADLGSLFFVTAIIIFVSGQVISMFADISFDKTLIQYIICAIVIGIALKLVAHDLNKNE